MVKEISVMAEDLEKFRSQIKYPDISPNNNINNILSQISNMDVMRKLDAMSLHEYSVVLSHYSLFLTDQVNRLIAKRDWCEGTIKMIVGRKLNDVPGGYFPEKDCYIRANDEKASELEKIRISTDTQIKAFNFTSQKFQVLSETLQSLAKEKSYSRRAYESN